MAPTEILAEQHARTLARVGRGDRAIAGAADRVDAAGGARVAAGAARRRQARRRRRHARAARRAGRVRAARHGGHRRAASLRRGAARAPARQGRPAARRRARGAAPAGHDRDADPAHAGAHRLRRSRPHHPRRAAARPRAAGDAGAARARPAAPRALKELRAALDAGRQAYWVCPLIEESEKLESADIKLADVTEAADWLAGELGDDVPIGLVHGRLPTAERDRVMRAFRAGELRVLVATTVIEVGVDVPAASMMVIEGAERFGLAQLHQLRGRIGRGGGRSTCLLVAGSRAGDAGDRLGVMAETSDGFKVAEEDLRIRGPGEIFGTRQAGPAAAALRRSGARRRAACAARAPRRSRCSRPIRCSRRPSTRPRARCSTRAGRRRACSARKPAEAVRPA